MSKPKITRQMEHNRVLTCLKGHTLTSVELLTLEGGQMPDGREYEGAAIRVLTRDAEGHESGLIILPVEDNNIEFHLFHCSEHDPPSESPESTVMHAADYLEDEARNNNSLLSRFRGHNSTVYVACHPLTIAHMNAAYESAPIEGKVQ